MTDKLSVGSTLSGERAVSIEVTQRDRDAAEPFRRGKGGKYDRDQEALAQAFALHAAPLREALESIIEDAADAFIFGRMIKSDLSAEELAEHFKSLAGRIHAARRALSPSYPMENYNGD